MAGRTEFEKALAEELGLRAGEEIHPALDRAEAAFFSQHYRQKTEIQKKAIAPIFSGKNALLVSATASGKTEAAVVPVAARILSEKKKALCLYISPTKALLNDLVRRLETPLKRLGLELALKHGDHDLPVEGKEFSFLFTTPESLEVLLCKRVKALERVRHVIVDEIHQIYNQPRGFHLLFLEERLKCLTKEPLQRIALSATVGHPSRLASWLKGSDEELPVFTTGAKRDIGAEFLFLGNVQSLRRWLSRVPAKKVLVFANTRRRCEEIFLALKGVEPYEVFVHYSTLEKPDREYVERRFKKTAYAACVATTTMELGIDIGSVEAVLLADAPHSVSSFLQRIGRGGRRTGRAYCYLAARDNKEMLQHCALLRLAQAGMMELEIEGCAYSVLVQQILSYVSSKTNYRILPEEIPRFCQAWTGYADSVEAILRSLEAKGYLASEVGWRSMRMGPKCLDLYNKAGIYSNIRDSGTGTAVFSRDRKLGILPLPSDVRRGNIILFAGRYWKVESVREAGITVSQASAVANPIVPRWGTAGLKTSDLVIQEMERLIKGETEPQALQKSERERLDKIRQTLVKGRKDWHFLHRQKGRRHTYYTFLGSFANEVLKLGLESRMKPAPEIQTRELGLISDIPLDFSKLPAADEIKGLVDSNWKLFSEVSRKGPFFNLLPPELQKEEVLSFLDYGAIEDVSELTSPRLLEIQSEL